ncbi:WD40 repeat protein [Saccharothrix saharensis]|uniref:WD40 repeat protein n=1 Tax=Saccharothrix saharensis TaxID=571190 RepID=A0A543J966_9PSEU|nr:TIR domain-containing protein [Saccharothrix saharensis]TQM79375.1 WD40 repeat protein [Saccharothrix saharensis]
MASDRAGYDAFLSYSHVADMRLASEVQRGLHRFAKRWYRPRALRVFRDQTSLGANPDLWRTIENALESSRFFILMASPQSARSVWVGREVEYWRANRERETFLIVLSEGEIRWDAAAGDFDWERTTALPRALTGWFAAEPLWVDLTWARDRPRLSIRNSSFRSELATLAAPLHGESKDRLDSEDDRQHRIATWLRWTAVGLVALLGLIAFVQGQAAITQRDQALSRALAARSEAIGDTDPDLSRLLSLAAAKISPTAEAATSMLVAGGRSGIARLDAGGQAVGAVAFSPDGTSFATAADTVVRLWDSRTRAPIGDLPVFSGTVRSVEFSPDGRTLAVAAHDSGGTLWDVATRRVVATELDGRPATATTNDHPAPAEAYAPDGRFLVVSIDKQRVRLLDPVTREQDGAVMTVADYGTAAEVSPSAVFSPDSRTLVTSGVDGTLRFWDTATQHRIGAPVKAYRADGASRVVPALAMSPTGETLVSAGADGSIRFWDVGTRQESGPAIPARTEVDRFGNAPPVAFSRDGGTLATGGQDGTVRLWDTRTRQAVGDPLAGHSRQVASLTFGPDGRTLISGAVDGTARLWDVSGQLRANRPMTGHVGPVYAAAFSPDGRTLATGGDYGWSPEQARNLFSCGQDGWRLCLAGANWLTTFSGVRGVPAGGVLNDVFSGEVRGGLALSPGTNPGTDWGSEGPSVRLWDDADKPVGSLSTGITRTVRSIAFSPDGTAVALAGVDVWRDGDKPIEQSGSVTLWDLRTGRQLDRLLAGAVAWSVAYSPDGRSLAVAAGDSEEVKPAVFLWDIATKTRTRTLLDGPPAVRVVFSPDGRTVAAGRDDGKVQLWDLTDPARDTTLTVAGNGPVGGMAFNATGDLLATGSDDGVIRLWDTTTRRQVGEAITGHTGPVYSVAFSPDGRLLATGSGDTSVRLWHIGSRRQISRPYFGHTRPVRAIAFSPNGAALASVGEDHSVRRWDLGYTSDITRTLCDTTRRSLTREEWQRHVPEVSYQEVCG